MKKTFIAIGAIILLIIIIAIVKTKSNQQATQNLQIDLNLKCVSESGKAYYPPTERCCNGLKSIFGEDHNALLCGLLNYGLVGAPVCAPCGNGKCETEFRENKCSCPDDCN